MRRPCRWLLGLLVAAAGCDGAASGNWVEVDLAGTDQTWNMYPDTCTRVDANTVILGERGYDGASLTLALDPLQGARAMLVIPDPVEGEPVSLWLSAADACETFAVEAAPGAEASAVRVDLACDLAWIGVWTSVTFRGC